MRQITGQEDMWIVADLNGHVGGARTGFEREHGGNSCGDRNAEGEEILQFAQSYDLGVVNTFFQKKMEHLITYTRCKYFDPCYVRATVVRARFLAAAFSDGSYLAHVNDAYLRHVTCCIVLIVSPISQRGPASVRGPLPTKAGFILRTP